ncbi:MAG: PorT family protein [Candidatus Amulumruptor caecigallinarius]|nr:MAG: PorT family protein [Candidatus Amulumruptor caecigallinarius]
MNKVISKLTRSAAGSAIIISLLSAFAAVDASAQYRDDKLLNRPHADNRAWHLGFSVGMHTEGLNLTNNGILTDGDNRQWYAEQPSYAPGFCINGLIDFRLNDFFSVRLSPGLWFGSRTVTFYNALPGLHEGVTESVDIKSTYIVVPVDLKYAARRWRNLRPYIVGGIMPAFDVGKKPDMDILTLKSTDCYLTVGFGCDFYLPFFKLIPEVKFCFGLSNILQTDRPALADQPSLIAFTNSLKKVTSNMVVVSFYFE